MSTVEDFRNAPIGATATDADGGRAMKIGDGEWSWVTTNRGYLVDEGMAFWNFTLAPTAPTTAREALDLAWNLAHEVKEGQVIPEGTQYLEFYISGLRGNTAQCDFEISPGRAPVRTLEPLPDPEPEPDWLDAPAVLAETSMCPTRKVWTPESGGVWKCSCCRDERHWYELVDVTPLYPKEGQDALNPSNSRGIEHEENNDD